MGAEDEPSVLSPRSPHPGGLIAGVHVPISSCDEWGVVRDSEQESSGVQAYVLGGRAQGGLKRDLKRAGKKLCTNLTGAPASDGETSQSSSFGGFAIACLLLLKIEDWAQKTSTK